MSSITRPSNGVVGSPSSLTEIDPTVANGKLNAVVADQPPPHQRQPSGARRAVKFHRPPSATLATTNGAAAAASVTASSSPQPVESVPSSASSDSEFESPVVVNTNGIQNHATTSAKPSLVARLNSKIRDARASSASSSSSTQLHASQNGVTLQPFQEDHRHPTINQHQLQRRNDEKEEEKLIQPDSSSSSSPPPNGSNPIMVLSVELLLYRSGLDSLSDLSSLASLDLSHPTPLVEDLPMDSDDLHRASRHTSRGSMDDLLSSISPDANHAADAHAVDVPKLRTIQIKLMSLVPNLISLNLSHNQLVQIEGLACMTRLKVLDLSHNRLASIEGLAQIPETARKLESLLLSHNAITSIDAISLFAPTLVTLDLRSNQITNRDTLKPLHQLINLQHLILTQNPVTFTPLTPLSHGSTSGVNGITSYCAFYLPWLLTLDGKTISEEQLSAAWSEFSNSLSASELEAHMEQVALGMKTSQEAEQDPEQEFDQNPDEQEQEAEPEPEPDEMVEASDDAPTAEEETFPAEADFESIMNQSLHSVLEASEEEEFSRSVPKVHESPNHKSSSRSTSSSPRIPLDSDRHSSREEEQPSSQNVSPTREAEQHEDHADHEDLNGDDRSASPPRNSTSPELRDSITPVEPEYLSPVHQSLIFDAATSQNQSLLSPVATSPTPPNTSNITLDLPSPSPTAAETTRNNNRSKPFISPRSPVNRRSSPFNSSGISPRSTSASPAPSTTDLNHSSSSLTSPRLNSTLMQPTASAKSKIISPNTHRRAATTSTTTRRPPSTTAPASRSKTFFPPPNATSPSPQQRSNSSSMSSQEMEDVFSELTKLRRRDEEQTHLIAMLREKLESLTSELALKDHALHAKVAEAEAAQSEMYALSQRIAFMQVDANFANSRAVWEKEAAEDDEETMTTTTADGKPTKSSSTPAVVLPPLPHIPDPPPVDVPLSRAHLEAYQTHVLNLEDFLHTNSVDLSTERELETLAQRDLIRARTERELLLAMMKDPRNAALIKRAAENDDQFHLEANSTPAEVAALQKETDAIRKKQAEAATTQANISQDKRQLAELDHALNRHQTRMECLRERLNEELAENDASENAQSLRNELQQALQQQDGLNAQHSALCERIASNEESSKLLESELKVILGKFHRQHTLKSLKQTHQTMEALYQDEMKAKQRKTLAQRKSQAHQTRQDELQLRLVQLQQALQTHQLLMAHQESDHAHQRVAELEHECQMLRRTIEEQHEQLQSNSIVTIEDEEQPNSSLLQLAEQDEITTPRKELIPPPVEEAVPLKQLNQPSSGETGSSSTPAPAPPAVAATPTQNLTKTAPSVQPPQQPVASTATPSASAASLLNHLTPFIHHESQLQPAVQSFNPIASNSQNLNQYQQMQPQPQPHNAFTNDHSNPYGQHDPTNSNPQFQMNQHPPQNSPYYNPQYSHNNVPMTSSMNLMSSSYPNPSSTQLQYQQPMHQSQPIQLQSRSLMSAYPSPVSYQPANSTLTQAYLTPAPMHGQPQMSQQVGYSTSQPLLPSAYPQSLQQQQQFPPSNITQPMMSSSTMNHMQLQQHQQQPSLSQLAYQPQSQTQQLPSQQQQQQLQQTQLMQTPTQPRDQPTPTHQITRSYPVREMTPVPMARPTLVPAPTFSPLLANSTYSVASTTPVPAGAAGSYLAREDKMVELTVAAGMNLLNLKPPSIPHPQPTRADTQQKQAYVQKLNSQIALLQSQKMVLEQDPGLPKPTPVVSEIATASKPTPTTAPVAATEPTAATPAPVAAAPPSATVKKVTLAPPSVTPRSRVVTSSAVAFSTHVPASTSPVKKKLKPPVPVQIHRPPTSSSTPSTTASQPGSRRTSLGGGTSSSASSSAKKHVTHSTQTATPEDILPVWTNIVPSLEPVSYYQPGRPSSSRHPSRPPSPPTRQSTTHHAQPLPHLNLSRRSVDLEDAHEQKEFAIFQQPPPKMTNEPVAQASSASANRTRDNDLQLQERQRQNQMNMQIFTENVGLNQVAAAPPVMHIQPSPSIYSTQAPVMTPFQSIAMQPTTSQPAFQYGSNSTPSTAQPVTTYSHSPAYQLNTPQMRPSGPSISHLYASSTPILSSPGLDELSARAAALVQMKREQTSMIRANRR